MKHGWLADGSNPAEILSRKEMAPQAIEIPQNGTGNGALIAAWARVSAP
jgi:hypothetical protein